MDDDLLPAVQKAYDLCRWLLPRIERFSRRHKFTLGDRLEGAAIDLCLALVEASHARKPDRALFRADRLLDQVRLLTRLSADMNEISTRQLAFVASLQAEVGRMIGGWRRSRDGARSSVAREAVPQPAAGAA